jgi:hypothetical protein
MLAIPGVASERPCDGGFFVVAADAIAGVERQHSPPLAMLSVVARKQSQQFASAAVRLGNAEQASPRGSPCFEIFVIFILKGTFGLPWIELLVVHIQPQTQRGWYQSS